MSNVASALGWPWQERSANQSGYLCTARAATCGVSILAPACCKLFCTHSSCCNSTPHTRSLTLNRTSCECHAERDDKSRKMCVLLLAAVKGREQVWMRQERWGSWACGPLTTTIDHKACTIRTSVVRWHVAAWGYSRPVPKPTHCARSLSCGQVGEEIARG
jgi:hypothetical protein